MAFFMDTRLPQQRFLNAPASVLWMIALILAAHVGRVMVGEPTATNVIVDYAFIPAWPADALTYFTYLFIHGSYLHVGINCLWLLVFGPPLAWRVGTLRFLALYFFCGVAAALAQLISDWGSMVPVVGASGAISGLMGGTIRIMYGTRLPAAPGSIRPPLAPISSAPVLFFSAVWLVMNVIVGVIGLGTTEEGEIVAWVAHMGGYVTGLLAVGILDRTLPGPR
jgi:membrane associated rhomboid family serine protease